MKCPVSPRPNPAAEYGQVKLVAAMANARAHWFATDAPQQQQRAQQQQAQQAQQAALQVQQQGENRPSNGSGSGSSEGQPDAKRPRLSGTPGQQQQTAAKPAAAALERGAVMAWLAQHGSATGPQLVQRFCGGGQGSPAARQQLVTLLQVGRAPGLAGLGWAARGMRCTRTATC